MDILLGTLFFILSSLIVGFVFFTIFMIRIFIDKSFANPDYPPVLGTVFHQLLYFNRLYDYHAEAAKKHRTYRLVSPNQSEIYTADVENIEYILKTNFHKYCKGKKNQDIAGDLLGRGIFMVDGDKWKEQRKLASAEFSTRVLRDFSSVIFRGKAVELVKKILDLSTAGGQVFDLQDLLMRSTMDTLFKVGFGVDLNCLDGSSRQGRAFMKAFDDSNELVYWRYVDPFWKMKRYLNIGSEALLKKHIKLMYDFVDDLIRTKRERLQVHRQTSEKEDILSRFLEASNKNPEKMGDEYLRDIILNFMIAGKDTSANTLSWFFYMLCIHPGIQERVLEELRSVTRSSSSQGSSSVDDFVASITDEVLDKTHYLHAALTETLRLYPVVPIDGRCAEADDVLPDGFKVNKGDGVYYLSYAMGRMAYIWGEDAHQFRPERWIQDGAFQPQSPFKFVAFHAGPRLCLGKDFAYRQMKIVAMALLYCFRFELARDPEKVTYRTMFTLHLKGGLPVVAVSRTSKI